MLRLQTVFKKKVFKLPAVSLSIKNFQSLDKCDLFFDPGLSEKKFHRFPVQLTVSDFLFINIAEVSTF